MIYGVVSGMLGAGIVTYLIFGYVHPLWIVLGGVSGTAMMAVMSYRRGELEL
jgi:hypothetical protein